jgi:hypothetical protein
MNMASKERVGSSFKFYEFVKGSYEGNGLKSDRWLKHQI